VVGNAHQVETLNRELHAVSSGGFVVERLPSRAAASVAVSDRQLAAAYIANPPSSPKLYVARAASAIRANYLQQVFGEIAGETHSSPPQMVDLVPLLSGDSGTGIFFFGFPLVMVGVITVLVLLQRAPTWSIERRMGAVVAIGTLGSLTAYITAITLNVLPNKILLLLVGFIFSQIIGQLLVGLVPLLKHWFLPVVMTFILVLGVPTAGATMAPDLLPTGLRYLSDILPFAQQVKITRNVAYFGGSESLAPSLILAVWAAIAAVLVGVAMRRVRVPRGVNDSTSAGSSSSQIGSGVLNLVESKSRESR
jgi:ABC-type multidrug transport system permease subunit